MDQLGFNFNATQTNDALLAWRQQRKQAHITLARKLGMPIDHEVEVWLHGGIRLRGVLRIKENLLFVADGDLPDLLFEVGKVSFGVHEMESCVRLD
jgi:hypothetical protein